MNNRLASDNRLYPHLITTLMLICGVNLSFLSLPARADTFLTEQGLRDCIAYEETAAKKQAAIEKLKDVMEEAQEYIDEFERQMQQLEWEINHSSGSERNALIDQYRAAGTRHNKFVDVHNLAADKINRLLGQYNTAVTRLEKHCYSHRVNSRTLNTVCGDSREGYCGYYE